MFMSLLNTKTGFTNPKRSVVWITKVGRISGTMSDFKENSMLEGESSSNSSVNPHTYTPKSLSIAKSKPDDQKRSTHAPFFTYVLIDTI